MLRRHQPLLLFVICLLWVTSGYATQPQAPSKPLTVAILDFGNGKLGRLTADLIASQLQSSSVSVIDRDMARVAAHGASYEGSLNLSVADARDLGVAIGCEFYILGDRQTLRRSGSSGAPYFEAYASVFIVSTTTGQLILWERPFFEAPTADAADQQLSTELQKEETRQRYLNALTRAHNEEVEARKVSVEHDIPIIEESDQQVVGTTLIRAPRPYRRLKPGYPDSAARADATGTVDVLVELDKDGEVSHADVARWAGFGLDDAALNTVRQLHFYPAMQGGVAIPVRVLLRYNFRRPK